MSMVRQDLYTLGEDMLSSPAARRALQVGLLEAKRSALRGAQRLCLVGWPLLIAIIGVSFLHIWDTIALIRPEWVEELKVAPGLYHASAAALTVAIDAAALFVVAAGAALRAAGQESGPRWPLAFFLLLTFLLNAAFVVRFAPALDANIRRDVLPALDLAFVVLLPAFVPIALVAIERARGELERLRLVLLVETTALDELVTHTAPQPAGLVADSSDEQPEKALTRENGRAVSPGRPAIPLAALLDLLPAGETTTRAAVVEQLRCGRTTADRLLAEGLEAGALERTGRGEYRRV